MFLIGQKINNMEIIGLTKADEYAVIHPSVNYENWDKQVPTWRKGLICTIKLDTPRKPLTIEDLQFNYPDKNYEEIEGIYEAMPTYKYITMPEQMIINEMEEIKTND